MSFVHRIDELIAEHGNGLTSEAEHWERVRLGAVAQVVNGFPFPSSGFNKVTGEAVLRIRDIAAGQIGTYFKGPPGAFPRVNHGDLVVGMDGDFNSCLWPGDSALMNQRVCKIVPDGAYYSKHLLAYVLPGYLKLINDHTSAITVKHLSSGTVADLPLPLPPRPEQDRLVSKLDELFSRIDEGERALQEVTALMERYRQSVLKAAVTGELTRDWRKKNKGTVEHGDTLLASILKARREAWEEIELGKMKAKGIKPPNDKWRHKYQEPAPPDASRLPELPAGWVWATAGQMCFVDTGATPKRGTTKYYEGGTIPWVTSAAVNLPLILEPTELITEVAIEETNAKVFPAGSLLVALYGEGKTRGKISELGIDAASNQACAALLCAHLDLGVKSYLRSFFEKNYEALRLRAAGGVQPNLNLAILKQTPIPLPSRQEIEEINQRLTERQSQLARIAAESSVWQRESTALRQAVLKSAFSGLLVSHDPSDEPATNLLKRIGAAVGDTAKRGRKKGPAE